MRVFIYTHSHIYIHISILVCMYVLSSHLLAGMNMLPRPIPAVLTCHVCHINKSPQEEYDLHLHSVPHRIKSLWYHGCPMVICNGCRVVLSGSVAEHEASAKHVALMASTQQLAPWITVASYFGEIPPRMINQIFVEDCQLTYLDLQALHPLLFQAYYRRYPMGVQPSSEDEPEEAE